MKKLGRPKSKEKSDKKMRMSYVDDKTYEFIRSLGSGNYSKGIVIAHQLLEGNKKDA